MPTIRARCADCDKGYMVDEKNAGKTLKCKACGGPVKIPAAAATGGAAVRSSSSAAAARPVAARPAAVSKPRPAPVAEAAPDGFGDMDALLALESGGTIIEQEPALAPPPLPTKPSRAAATPGMPPRPGSTIPQRRPGWQKNNDMGNGLTGAQLGKILGIGGGAVALIFLLGLVIKPFTIIAFSLLMLIGGLLLLIGWGGCLMCAAREGVWFLYVFVPYYPIYFILTRIEETKLYILSSLSGAVCMAGAVGLIFNAGNRASAELPQPVARPAFVLTA
jgi:hypothetical protein